MDTRLPLAGRASDAKFSVMKIAITGGTGFVGSEIVWQAKAAGINVCLVPHAAVSNPDLLPDILAGANCVIHLVGIVFERGANTFESAHVEATRNVVTATAHARIRRYLHMSALGTRPDARSRYHQTKWRAEEIVRQSSLAWTIFRPSVIYGPGDKSFNVLAKIIRRLPVIPVLGDGTTLLQPVAVKTVAEAFLAALRNDGSIGQTYDLCGPVVLSWNELYDRLLKLLHREKSKVHLPMPVARNLARLWEGLPVTPPFTRDQLLMLEEDNTGSSTTVEQDLALVQEPLGEGLARYLTS
jgi:uncharacterized protein YbjT (DUF2867 family)